MGSRPTVTVLDHFDPECTIPGGIDNIIHDFIAYGPDIDFRLIGITTSNRKLGEWGTVDFAGRKVPFLPVARFDRRAKRGSIRVPHSMKYIGGLLRFRKSLGETDAWHAHRVETGLTALLLERKPLVQYVHNAVAALSGTNSTSSWAHLGNLYPALATFMVKRAHKVVVFNRDEARRLSRVREDVIRGRTWYDPEQFYPAPYAPPSPANQMRVIWVGRFAEEKNPMLALRVAEMARERGLPIAIELVGGGPLDPALREYVSRMGLSNVHFMGPIARDLVAERLRSSHVYLSTSYYEGSSTSLVEALACSVPCVTTQGADQDDLVVPGETGYHCSTDPDDVLSKILRADNLTRTHICASVSDRQSTILAPRLAAVGLPGLFRDEDNADESASG